MTDSSNQSKLEIDNNDEKLSKALARVASTSSTTTTTSRQWAGFKNPRIVRVSRTFGGKDRHSKVCTIRGLRDRRIRLSVPTAIQLYDLQDRLGLSQPSKVIDWLLEATKLDIDKLPPLQIPPGSFVDFHQQSLFGHLGNPAPYLDPSSKEGININADLDEDDEDGHNEEPKSNNNVQVSAQSFFPMGGSSINNGYFPGLPYGNMYHWDPSSLSLAQFGSHSQADHQDPHHINNNNNSNYNGVGSSTHQLFFCPPLATTSLFPQNENRFQLGSNNSNNSMSSHFVSHDASQQDKDHHQHGN